MSLLLVAPNRDKQPFKTALLAIDSNLDVEIWPDVQEKNRVQFAVAWNQPKHLFEQYPNLKAISSLGAGVNHILNDKTIPEHLPVCRIICDSLLTQMKEYVLSAVLNYQHNIITYFQQKQQGRWKAQPNKSPANFSIGIMGLGEIGKPIASRLAKLGYQIKGWSKSPKNIEGVETFSGENQLNEFIAKTTVLVCLLPLTAETEGILNLEIFKQMQHPGYLINVARGEHLVEEDLIYALDKGWLKGACLDVFSEEPLPEKHPFWNRESIFITPHAASITNPEDAAVQIVDNYKRALSGIELKHTVDRDKGY
jgi:glyoxylate/hydroxypyruvate reductase A